MRGMKNSKKRWMGKAVSISLLVAFIFQMTACGTILHPERRGQGSGRIDPTIAVLDGIGLLFFIIPGVIAFAVDFSNDTIYLPAGQSDYTPSLESLDMNNMRAVSVDEGRLDDTNLESIIESHTGLTVDLSDPKVQRHAL